MLNILFKKINILYKIYEYFVINIYKFVLFPDSTWRSVISTPPHCSFLPKITRREVSKVSDLGILLNSNFFSYMHILF